MPVLIEAHRAPRIVVFVAVDRDQRRLAGLAEPRPQAVHLHRPIIVAIQQQETRLDHVTSRDHTTAGQLIGLGHRIFDVNAPGSAVAKIILHDFGQISEE